MEYEHEPLWGCLHQYKSIGLPTCIWASNKIEPNPPETAQWVQKRQCILCNGVEYHAVYFGDAR